MINGNINEFINHIQYGEELLFLYKDKEFFLEGIYEPGLPKEAKNFDLGYERRVYTLCLFQTKPVNKGTNNYVWVLSKENKYPVEEFLEAAIFDGKTFWEVEQEITWID